jgi:hypothetical protein
MGVFFGLYGEWLYLKGVLDDTPEAGLDFVLRENITSWPPRFIIKSGDLLVEVIKADDGDSAQQGLQIVVLSTEFPRFLYDNRLDWPWRHLKLPWLHLLLKGRRGRDTLASAIHSVALNAAELKSELGSVFQEIRTPYQSQERLCPIGFTHLGEERIKTYLRALAEAISDPELAVTAFQPRGVIAENLAAGDAGTVIYLALKAGRKPDAVMECLSGFDISERRAEIEEFVKRAYMRMYEPAAAARLPRPPRLRRGWRERVEIAKLIRWAVIIFAMLAGWLGGSWSLVALPAGVLSLQRLPDWQRALALGRHIDANYEPPISFGTGLGLALAASVLGNLLLCTVAFALGRVVALWW